MEDGGGGVAGGSQSSSGGKGGGGGRRRGGKRSRRGGGTKVGGAEGGGGGGGKGHGKGDSGKGGGRGSGTAAAASSFAKNDYAQHFVDTGLRPANFIRDSHADFEEYPKLKELIERKDELVSARATPPTYKRVDLKTFDLTTLGTKFDVILVDPPWEEYQQRKAACGGAMLAEGEADEVWTPQDIMDLRLDLVGENPSFVFLWAGSGASLQWGRACLKQWGYRRCEDICWVKSNRETGRNHHWLPDSVVASTTEHCLVGIKGTVKRNHDGHLINANIDTDVMLSEEPPYGATAKPAELYAIIERFAQGRRRLELFGEDSNIRRGWLTVGRALSSSNHDPAEWRAHFEGSFESCAETAPGPRRDQPVRLPPPPPARRYNFDDEPPQELPNHLLGTTVEIESLRPKSPTQLREEATARALRQHEQATLRAQQVHETERAAAAEMGIELPPPDPASMPTMPPVPSFREQSPFTAPR
jgi:N6-adenosine-specific RNA methylase IME4